MNNYKLPINFVRIFESGGQLLATCSDKESIDMNLELIITTCPGEHKYDPEYGCKIWNLDFEKVVSLSLWEGEFLQYITEAISRYEPRIYDVEPKVHFFDTRTDLEMEGFGYVRKRADIYIDAKILSTGAKCRFFYPLYLGPLSSD